MTCCACGCRDDAACVRVEAIEAGELDLTHDLCHWIAPHLCSACGVEENRGEWLSPAEVRELCAKAAA